MEEEFSMKAIIIFIPFTHLRPLLMAPYKFL